MVRRTLDFADDPLRATAVCDPKTGWADMVAVWASGWGRGKGAEGGPRGPGRLPSLASPNSVPE